MSTIKSTVDVLRDAKALLETKGWTQSCMARDAANVSVMASSLRASCFCAYGAIEAGLAPDLIRRLAGRALDATTPEVEWFPEFNDTEGRTLPEVLAKFDEAIAAEEAKLFDAELHDWMESATPGGTIYYGLVYGDKKGRFKDGEAIRTSFEQEVSNGILRTRNTRYKLGDRAAPKVPA